MNPAAMIDKIDRAHRLYCQLTGQQLQLRYDRERLWFEWFRAGFTLEDLRRVVIYLQRQIGQQRRNVGALKITNLLQPDRFEEDLNISRVRLMPRDPPLRPRPQPSATLSPQQREQRRQHALQHLRMLKKQIF